CGPLPPESCSQRNMLGAHLLAASSDGGGAGAVQAVVAAEDGAVIIIELIGSGGGEVGLFAGAGDHAGVAEGKGSAAVRGGAIEGGLHLAVAFGEGETFLGSTDAFERPP